MSLVVLLIRFQFRFAATGCRMCSSLLQVLLAMEEGHPRTFLVTHFGTELDEFIDWR